MREETHHLCIINTRFPNLISFPMFYPFLPSKNQLSFLRLSWMSLVLREGDAIESLLVLILIKVNE